MDKLYASTDAVGVVSEVLLAVLNTNVFSPSSSFPRISHYGFGVPSWGKSGGYNAYE